MNNTASNFSVNIWDIYHLQSQGHCLSLLLQSMRDKYLQSSKTQETCSTSLVQQIHLLPLVSILGRQDGKDLLSYNLPESRDTYQILNVLMNPNTPTPPYGDYLFHGPCILIHDQLILSILVWQPTHQESFSLQIYLIHFDILSWEASELQSDFAWKQGKYCKHQEFHSRIKIALLHQGDFWLARYLYGGHMT